MCHAALPFSSTDCILCPIDLALTAQACLVFDSCARVCLHYREFDPWRMNRYSQLPVELALVSRRRARDIGEMLRLPQPPDPAALAAAVRSQARVYV